MTYRVEHADALTLLRELPDGWAQTCITRPPRDETSSRVLAILTEVKRVLRDDSTMWVFASSAEQQLLADLQTQGFRQQSTPSWAAQLTASGRGLAGDLFLFSKQARYFYDAHAIDRRQRPSVSSCHLAWERSRHFQRCAVAFAHERDLRLIRQCILAGSSRVACGQCGAPYRRARSNESGARQPTCQHNSPDGRCLVLDPFCTPSPPSAEAALRTGRSFLGITDASGEQSR
jgi:hypothetical protein